MHELNGANQWHISIGGDYGLNFASYVGCSVGALRGPGGQHVWPASGSDPGLPDSDSLKLAYEQWWLELVRYKTDCILAGRHPLLHQPPGFETVADPALRQTCAGLWPAFIEWWEMEVGGRLLCASGRLHRTSTIILTSLRCRQAETSVPSH